MCPEALRFTSVNYRKFTRLNNCPWIQVWSNHFCSNQVETKASFKVWLQSESSSCKKLNANQRWPPDQASTISNSAGRLWLPFNHQINHPPITCILQVHSPRVCYRNSHANSHRHFQLSMIHFPGSPTKLIAGLLGSPSLKLANRQSPAPAATQSYYVDLTHFSIDFDYSTSY